ncbi:MAG: outer membrane beta-barrel protein [Bdellovibrio sp.]
MKKLLAVFALVLGFANTSNAGLMIEPYLGYEFGKTKDAIDGSLSGSQMGLRLAYSAPVLFWAGLDGTFGSSATLKPDSGSNETAKRTTVYGVVGLNFPILLRAWYGYSFMDEVNFEVRGKAKGSGSKLGVGFTGLPFVSLNFEYLNEKFTSMNGVDISPALKNDSYIFSVSLPINL